MARYTYDQCVRWAKEFIATHQESSVTQVVRIGHGAGYDHLTPAIVTDIRRGMLKGDEPVTQQVPAVAAVKPKPRCRLCQGEHYSSQCTKYVEADVVFEDPNIPQPIEEEKVPPMQVQPKPVDVAVRTIKSLPEGATITAAPSPHSPTSFGHRQLPTVTPAPENDVGRTRSVEGMMRRRTRLNELLLKLPDLHPNECAFLLRQEFGMGLDTSYVYETCRAARELHKLPPLADGLATGKRKEHSRQGLGALQHEEAEERDDLEDEEVDDGTPSTPDDELEYLAQRMAEVIRAHSLTSANVTFANGEISWDFEVRRQGKGKLKL